MDGYSDGYSAPNKSWSFKYRYASLNDGDTVLNFVVVRTCTYTNLDSTVRV